MAFDIALGLTVRLGGVDVDVEVVIVTMEVVIEVAGPSLVVVVRWNRVAAHGSGISSNTWWATVDDGVVAQDWRPGRAHPPWS